MRRFPLGIRFMLASALGALIAAPATLAEPTSTGSMSLQGRLTGVSDGTRELTLFLHDAETGGNQVASFGPLATTVSGGLFNLNVQIPPATFDGRTLWWSASVDASPQTSRVLITSVPYAMNAVAVGGSAVRTRVVGAPPSVGVQTLITGGASVLNGEQNFAAVVENGWGDGAGLKIEAGFANPGSTVPLLAAIVTTSNGQVGVLRVTQGAGVVVQSPLTNAPANQTVFRVDGRNTADYFSVTESGMTRVRVLNITGGSDLAEPFPASPVDSGVSAKPGMVLSIDPDHPGALRVATEAYDPRVAGVYSGGNGLPTGMIMGKEGCDLTAPGEDRLPLAMTGRVWVYADESNGAIVPGDRLTTSGLKPGHAMKVTDAARADGSVIGKAMTRVDVSTGMVLVLVNLQ